MIFLFRSLSTRSGFAWHGRPHNSDHGVLFCRWLSSRIDFNNHFSTEKSYTSFAGRSASARDYLFATMLFEPHVLETKVNNVIDHFFTIHFHIGREKRKEREEEEEAGKSFNCKKCIYHDDRGDKLEISSCKMLLVPHIYTKISLSYRKCLININHYKY